MSIDADALALLKESQANKRSVFFSSNAVDVTFLSSILDVRSDHVLIKNAVHHDLIRQVRTAQSFFLQVEMTRFVADRIETDGNHIVFPLGSLKVIPETRVSSRYPFRSEERVICRLKNPYDDETFIEKPVMDMSATGLSIRTSHSSKLFRKGTFFDDLRILIDAQPYAACKGTVVYIRKLMDSSKKLDVQVGFQLETDTTV